MKKAVIVFSGGIDSVCAVSYLKSKYELYGITFSYGQKADMEITAAKSFAKKLGLKQKIIDCQLTRHKMNLTKLLVI